MRHSDEGSSMIESLLLTVLMILPLAFAVVAFGSLQRAAIAVNSAAREAGRAFTTSSDPGDAAGRATRAANSVLRSHGLSPGASWVNVEGSLVRGGVVRVEVRYRSRVIEIPLLTDLGPVEIRSTHVEVVDRHRSIVGS